MRRRAPIVSMLVLALTGIGPAAQASWLVTKTVANQADAAGVSSDPARRIFMTFREPALPTPAGYIASYASFAAFSAAAPTIVPGSTVMYDTESWDFTPHPERTGKRRPYRYMRQFVALAHSYGLKVGLCPSGRYLPAFSGTKAALRVAADFFVIQLSNLAGGRDLSDQVHGVTSIFAGPVYFKLAAIPGHDMAFLLRQWRTVRRWTPNYVLWGGRPRDPISAQLAVDFLKRFA